MCRMIPKTRKLQNPQPKRCIKVPKRVRCILALMPANLSPGCEVLLFVCILHMEGTGARSTGMGLRATYVADGKVGRAGF